jgi:hypothetical protein
VNSPVLNLKTYRTPHYTTRSVYDGTRLVRTGHTRENPQTNATVYDLAASRASGFPVQVCHLKYPNQNHT